MRAVWSGRQIAIEGEPEELALLTLTLTEAGVDVQHTHTWQVSADGVEDGVLDGACACGERRQFTPWAKQPHGRTHPTKETAAPPAAAKAVHKCARCRNPGHTARTCNRMITGRGG